MQSFEVVIERLDGEASEVYLDQGITSFGRAQDNQIVLDDPVVSGHHGLLRARMNILMIEDRGSRNGLRVNGELVNRKTLFAGDTVAVGSSKIHVKVGSRNPRGFL